MSDHPRCPYCGSTLEGFEGPEELEALAVHHFDEIRRADDLADRLEETTEKLEVWSEPQEPSRVDRRPLSLRECLRKNRVALSEWRLRHPKRSSPEGDNPGEKFPIHTEETA